MVDVVEFVSEVFEHLGLSVAYQWQWMRGAEIFGHFVGSELALARTLVTNQNNDAADLRADDAETTLKAYHAFKQNFPWVKHVDTSPLARLGGTADPQTAVEAMVQEAKAFGYASRFKTACGGRKLCVTASERLALLPALAQINDVMAIIPGVQVPYILRTYAQESREPSKYQLVGECYLGSAMEGEFADSEESTEIMLV